MRFSRIQSDERDCVSFEEKRLELNERLGYN